MKFYLLGSLAFIAGSLVLLCQARSLAEALPSVVYISGSVLFLAGTVSSMRKRGN